MKILPVTALSTWIHCPNQFYVTYVLKEPTRLNAAMMMGLVKHKLHELMDEKEQKIVIGLQKEDVAHEHFERAFRTILTDIVKKYANGLRRVQVQPLTAFQKSIAIVKFEAQDRAQRIQPLIAQGLQGEELWNAITPKIKTEYSLQSKILGLKGRVDRLECYESTLVPVELKSGSAPAEGVYPHHRIQAAAYAIMLEEQFNTTVNETIVHYVDHHSRRTIVMNPFLREHVAETAKAARACLESKELPEGCGREKCRACTMVVQKQLR